MKIQYASDLHLEFAENSFFLQQNPLKPVGDVLVLAGDIGYLDTDSYTKHPFWDWASTNYERVIVAVGNHELYQYYDLAKMPQGVVCKIRKNVFCYYNAVVRAGNADIIISTLWSKIPPQNAFWTEKNVSDFYRIRYNGYRLSADTFNAEHERCLSFVKDKVSQSKVEHIVVVTHHVPSFILSSPDFRGSRINGAFTVELSDYIETSPIKYWIYGHSHRNIDCAIGNTCCVSNQLGYVSQNENLSFNAEKIIEIL
jgi:predicted phosphodiesterase